MAEKFLEVTGIHGTGYSARVLQITNGVRLTVMNTSKTAYTDLSIPEARHIARQLYRLAAKAAKAT